jgi:enamine deaminase RidA (YjgF/YER057c/UK114 family)
MKILQPENWKKPRGYVNGVALDGPGRWIVLAGQTGQNEDGSYPSSLAEQTGNAMRKICTLLTEAGAGPEHMVKLTWLLTSRDEYGASGAGIGEAWKQNFGRNFPPSTLVYVAGLVDVEAKVELEVTGFV